MKRKVFLSLLILTALGVSVAAYYRAGSGNQVEEFITAAVTRGEVADTVEATGTLEAVETVEVGTQVSGAIKSLHADFNSSVAAGQVVARLEPSLFQTQVEQADASLLRTQADLERARVQVDDTRLKFTRAQELWAKELIPRTDLETAEVNRRQAESSVRSAEAQVAQARAALNQARVNLGHTIIRVPIEGIVISRNVEVGQTVAASMAAPTLFVVARDLARMQVNASIDEADIGRVKAGQTVAFTVDAYPDQTFHGTVAQVRLQPVVQSNVVSYVTIVNVPNEDLRLRPGMTANVSIEVARADDVLRVANSALRFRAEAGEADARVWRLENGQPVPVTVKTGLTDGTVTAVVGGGLVEHQRVVTGVNPQAAALSTTSSSPLLPAGGRRLGRGAQGRR